MICDCRSYREKMPRTLYVRTQTSEYVGYSVTRKQKWESVGTICLGCRQVRLNDHIPSETNIIERVRRDG